MHQTNPSHLLACSISMALSMGALAGSPDNALEQTQHTSPESSVGYGPLIPDPAGLLDLPAGFSYTMISSAGETMDDGFTVPGKHDGMGTFPYINNDGSIDPDRTIIIRNHEVGTKHTTQGPFDAPASFGQIDPSKVYDHGHGQPLRGSTTTLVYNTKLQKLEQHWLSLTGTERLCAGGVTPNRSWLACEETSASKRDLEGKRFEQDHGYVFEVPATTSPQLADPKPIKQMGRFMHEACAVDPKTGIVYMTEDRSDGLFYRYVPNDPNDLHAGGSLEALGIDSAPFIDLRNWKSQAIAPGKALLARWIKIEHVESPDDNLRQQGYLKGALRFARGEGMWFGNQSVYFAASTGGRTYSGQIWRLIPSPDGMSDVIELIAEPNDPKLLERADNITISPWGSILICEDESRPPRLVDIPLDAHSDTPPAYLARNARGKSEFAGAVFSPDGSTLFVNLQAYGLTFAITGPWKR